MIGIPGKSEKPIVIGHADELIALAHPDDLSYPTAVYIVDHLIALDAQVLFQLIAVAEAKYA